MALTNSISPTNQIHISQVEHALAHKKAQLITRDEHKLAAVGLLLRQCKAGLEILFIQRSNNPNDPWSGQIAFPGGRYEPTDSDLLTTCKREVLEEIHLKLDGTSPVKARYLGALDELQGQRASLKTIIIACHVFFIEEAHYSYANHEVQRIDWVPLSYLLAIEHQSSLLWPIASHSTQTSFPCIKLPYADLKLWGITYRFVVNFFQKLGLAQPPLSLNTTLIQN